MRGYYGRQQNVNGAAGVVVPIGSPPPGWQVPGVYVNGPAALLPSADPEGTLTQLSCIASSGSGRGSGALHALSLKKEIEPAHAG